VGRELATAPATVLYFPPRKLAALLHNDRKAQYLSTVIAFFLETDERYLHTGLYDEVAACIRGLGAWSAGFILIRGLGRMERVDPTGRELAGATPWTARIPP
jgi:DNA-3-methyladenine glycosylase II